MLQCLKIDCYIDMKTIITHQDNEIWLPVPDYEGYYEVSNFGGVRSVDRIVLTERGSKLRVKGNVKNPTVLKAGYLVVGLHKGNKTKAASVHRLVGLAFIPNPNKEQFSINHKDGNKANNHVSNLEWATLEENTKHQWATGLANPSGCFKGVLSFEIAEEIRAKRQEHKYTNKALGNMYNVSSATISLILNNKIWKPKS